MKTDILIGLFIKENIDSIVGIVYTKDVLLKLRKQETITLADKKFQRKHLQMAIIIDEYDNEHLLVQKKDETNFIVQAQGSILNITQRLPQPIELSNDYTTLAAISSSIKKSRSAF